MKAFKFMLLNLTGLALFLSGWQAGWIPGLIESDITKITWIILALVVVGSIGFAFDFTRQCRWITRRLTLLGLLGTLIGLRISINEMSLAGGLESDVADASLIISGIGAAIVTSIFGFVGFLWLSLTEWVYHETDDCDPLR